MTDKKKNTFSVYFATRLPGIVFLIWTYALIWLVNQHHYKAFLQPILVPFLVVGIVITAIFSVSFLMRKPSDHSCGCESAHGHTSFQQSLVCALILLLPLCFLLAVYDKSLGSFALSRRSTGAEAYITGNEYPSPDTISVHDDTTLPSADEPTPIYTVLSKWQEYTGKKVTIEGAVMKNDQFEANQCLVYRFLIQCCAADARPIGIVIFSDSVPGLKNDDWIRVTGTFDIQEFQGNRVATMKVTSLVAQPQPPIEKKYVYPF